MQKCLHVLGLFLFLALSANAQTIPNSTQDTFVNVGKIAAKKAAIRSAILPGLGQITNKTTVWSIGKVGLIYGGAAALTISYIDNTRMYNVYLDELRYRQINNNVPNPNSPYATYPTQSLITAKDVYRRNRELIIFSYVGIYAINIIDAYVSARLKYFDVDQNVAIRISPSVIRPDYGFAAAPAPALKLSLKL